jgi:hypothetical protein
MITLEEIDSAALKHPYVYGMTYIDLLQNRKWETKTRPWTPALYQVVNPYYIEKYPVGQSRKLVVMKSTQCGLSTMGITRMFHFADYWPIRCFYMLPRDKDVIDFVSTRIDPMIAHSPRLKSKMGKTDRTGAKEFGDSYLFFMEATVEPRMMPCDVVMKDEIDLCDQTHLATANNRMDASPWKLEYNFSTPTVSNYGVHGMYLYSDMREWLVRCRYCSYEQKLDWQQNLRVLGPTNKPTKVFYGCAQCNEELTMSDILNGRWVAEQPDRTPYSIGFHISQMMIFPAAYLYGIFRDPETKLFEFYRKRLGQPYEIGEGSLERDDFLVNCFDEPVAEEAASDGESRYYMGLDQGNELQVMISKIPRGEKRPRVVYIELIPFDKGFERVGQLMRIFRIRRCVADGNPNRHSVAKLQKVFPGRVLIADYIEQRPRYKISRDPRTKVPVSVTIQRTQGFDNLLDSIRKGYWLLFGTPPGLPPIIETLIDHTTALRRDIEIRRTQSGETQVGVYRSIRADHLAHAWEYMHTAIEIDQGKKFRIEFIDIGGEDEQPDEDFEKVVTPEEIGGITYYLAEVPISQLREYLAKRLDDEYELPFPLSFKMKVVLEKYNMPKVEYVISHLVEKHDEYVHRRG